MVDMPKFAPTIRNAARALILSGDQVLLLRKEDDDGSERFSLPGGAQDVGETLEQALQRECLEEIGTRVQVHGLRFVADYFKPKQGMPSYSRHQIEFLFHCSVPTEYRPMNGEHPDKHQVEVVWVGPERLQKIKLLPRAYIPCILDGTALDRNIYLGLID